MVIQENLKTFFWNCRRIINKKPELNKYAINYDLIICIEIWLPLQADFDIPNFRPCRNNRVDRRRGGSIILVKNNYIWSPLPNIRISRTVNQQRRHNKYMYLLHTTMNNIYTTKVE